MGFRGIITEGKDHLGLYSHPYHSYFKILLRHNSLSEDIGHRFANNGGLDVNEYFKRIEDSPGVTMLAMDYETFGEHASEDTGITKFLRDLILKVLSSDTVQLVTPSEVIKTNTISEKLDVPEFISWGDEGKDLSAWLENAIQNEAFLALQSIEDLVKKSGNREFLDTWRNLQTSDHFFYMSTKTNADGDMHSYFSHYNSPYEAYINYMNVLNDFRAKLQHAPAHDPMETLEFERRHEPVPHWAEKAQANYHELTSR
jgi:alpha-amylase